MQPLPISSTFTNFLNQNTQTQLQITFASLEILTYQNRQFLNQVQQQKSRIHLLKVPHHNLAEITVLDNLVFSFSFQFGIPAATDFHDGVMLSLPRPLDQGRIYLDEEKLLLSFRIDAPDPSLRIHVTHLYSGILGLEQIPASLCGERI